VVERNGWICARKDDGYLALYVGVPYRWMTDDQGQDVEVRADTRQSAWVCEMGEKGQYADFAGFVQAVTSARIQCDGLQVSYESPSQGSVSFGWQGDLVVAGEVVPLHNYPRFDNPYCQTPFQAPQVVARRGDEQLVLDFAAAAAR
jgi:hypothetical protein